MPLTTESSIVNWLYLLLVATIAPPRPAVAVLPEKVDPLIVVRRDV